MLRPWELACDCIDPAAAQSVVKGAFPFCSCSSCSLYSAPVSEIVPVLAKLRPLLILIVLGLLVVFGTGQFMKVLKTPVGKTIAIFTVWFIACIPFAAWPGGSFQQFTEFGTNRP